MHIEANTRAPPRCQGCEHRSRPGWNVVEAMADANIGIATGSSSGIFVVDVDGRSGRASLEALRQKHGPLPKTVTVKTGRGRHLYFRCDGAQVGNSASRVAKGIDIRGDGGYVVGAGSVHAAGTLYRFVNGRALREIEVAAAPAWLLALISKPNSTRGVEERPSRFRFLPPSLSARALT